jgi:hypothetical protein
LIARCVDSRQEWQEWSEEGHEEGAQVFEEGRHEVIEPDREYWLLQEIPIEFITSHAVGFPIKVYWGSGPGLQIGERPDSYQIMTITKADLQHVPEFWDWHTNHNPQWFETPIEAAAAFVEAWLRFQKMEKGEES